MFKVDNISIRLGDAKTISSNTLTIDKGLWALVGRNGAGKSTFLNALIGNRNLDRGEVYWLNESISSIPLNEKAKQIGVVFTKPNVFGNYTVRDVVGLGRLPYQNAFSIMSTDDIRAIDRAMMTLNLKSLENHLFSTLSDGEKQLVMIGRALAQDTACIILDEPTAFLDVVNRRYIIEVLSEIVRKTDKIILFSTHDVELISTHCDGLIWIADNQIMQSGDQAKFDQQITELFKNEVQDRN